MSVPPMVVLVLIISLISTILVCGAAVHKRRQRRLETARIERLIGMRAARENLQLPTRFGLAKHITDSFPTMTFSETNHAKEDSVCTVCLVDYEPQDVLKQLPCSHSFHASCLNMWLNSNTTCPICRVSFSADSSIHKEPPSTAEGDVSTVDSGTTMPSEGHPGDSPVAPESDLEACQ